jgi:hypothetical protein
VEVALLRQKNGTVEGSGFAKIKAATPRKVIPGLPTMN